MRRPRKGHVAARIHSGASDSESVGAGFSVDALSDSAGRAGCFADHTVALRAGAAAFPPFFAVRGDSDVVLLATSDITADRDTGDVTDTAARGKGDQRGLG